MKISANLRYLCETTTTTQLHRAFKYYSTIMFSSINLLLVLFSLWLNHAKGFARQRRSGV